MADDEEREAIVPASITCVAGVKDRPWQQLHQWYESLGQQTVSGDVVVVDYSSQPRVELRPLVWWYSWRLKIIRVKRGTERWSEARALNIGIRNAETQYVMTTNADLIYPSGFVAAVVAQLQKNDRSLVLADRYDLAKMARPLARRRVVIWEPASRRAATGLRKYTVSTSDTRAGASVTSTLWSAQERTGLRS